jgi:hypothetical protein
LSEKGKIAAIDRVNELLSSNYTPKILREKGIKKLHEYLEVIDTDLASIHADFSDKIKGAYFIHSAGYIYLLMKFIGIKFSMKTLRLQKHFNLFHPL